MQKKPAEKPAAAVAAADDPNARGFCKRKRSLPGPPDLLGVGIATGKGGGISSFFAPDADHHKDAWRPGLGRMEHKTLGLRAAENAARQARDRGRLALQGAGLVVGLQPALGTGRPILQPVASPLEMLVDAAGGAGQTPVGDWFKDGVEDAPRTSLGEELDDLLGISDAAASSTESLPDGATSKPAAAQAKRRTIVATSANLTLHEKAALIYLHIGLGPQDAGSWSVLSKTVSGLNRTTAMNWMSTKTEKYQKFIVKWLPIVEKLTWARVKDILAKEKAFIARLEEQAVFTDTYRLPADSLEKYQKYRAVVGRAILSRDTVPDLAGARRASMAKKDESKFANVKAQTKSVRARSSRKLRWPVQEQIAKEIFVEAWEKGRPITMSVLKAQLKEKFPEGTSKAAYFYGRTAIGDPQNDFYLNYMGHEQNTLSKYSNWIKDVLDRAGYSVQKKTVSQKIPDSWEEDSKEFVMRMRRAFKAFGVTVTLGMDQTFILFHPSENDAVIAPTNSDRVTTTVASDDKEGVTLAVTCELGKRIGSSYMPGKIAEGYWVLTGKTCVCPDVDHHKAHSPPHMTKLIRGTKTPTPGCAPLAPLAPLAPHVCVDLAVIAAAASTE